jgi:electron transfer flavoprotein alpha subunit
MIEKGTICALIMCRNGVLPAGAAEAFDVAGRSGVVIGTDVAHGAANLPGPGSVTVIESEGWFGSLAELCSELEQLQRAELVVIPASPDGRDLAPLVAIRLHRSHIAGVTRIRHQQERFEITAVRSDGLVDHVHVVDGPAVVSLIPGLGGVISGTVQVDVQVHSVASRIDPANQSSVRSISILAPDPTTMDLTEATSIVAGGQGLGSKERFDQLARIGQMLGASLGGTRVASDAGWIPFERQIGTTGVAVNPTTYLAFGISGATQHTSGLGSPDHIISVNTDPGCPMMLMSNVAIVSDAQAVLDSLEEKLRAGAIK